MRASHQVRDWSVVTPVDVRLRSPSVSVSSSPLKFGFVTQTSIVAEIRLTLELTPLAEPGVPEHVPSS
jgi:hypothetical protein